MPERTCIGCRQVKKKSELIRIVAGEERLKIDLSGKAAGRGLYICPDRKCLEAAWKKNGIRRSLKRNIDKEELDRLYEELAGYEEKNL